MLTVADCLDFERQYPLRFREEFYGRGSKPSNSMRTMLYMMSWYQEHAKTAEARRAAETSP